MLRLLLLIYFAPSQNQIRIAQIQLVKKIKSLWMGPIILHTKFEPNLCLHAGTTAVFVCASQWVYGKHIFMILGEK